MIQLCRTVWIWGSAVMTSRMSQTILSETTYKRTIRYRSNRNCHIHWIVAWRVTIKSHPLRVLSGRITLWANSTEALKTIERRIIWNWRYAMANAKRSRVKTIANQLKKAKTASMKRNPSKKNWKVILMKMTTFGFNPKEERAIFRYVRATQG